MHRSLQYQSVVKCKTRLQDAMATISYNFKCYFNLTYRCNTTLREAYSKPSISNIMVREVVKYVYHQWLNLSKKINKKLDLVVWFIIFCSTEIPQWLVILKNVKMISQIGTILVGDSGSDFQNTSREILPKPRNPAVHPLVWENIF